MGSGPDGISTNRNHVGGYLCFFLIPSQERYKSFLSPTGWNLNRYSVTACPSEQTTEPQITMKVGVFFCLLALSLGDEGESACSDPRDVGPCRGNFLRYFFNPESASCEEFVYGGCGGNDNNFLSLKECQAACLSGVKRQASLVDSCNLPRKEGLCDAYFPRYFYNPASGACERFIYGGCQGNANNFLSEQECERVCVSQAKRDVTSTPDCSLPSETGPCKAYFPRYFFNTKTGACEQFIYGGCDGNDNNFLSVDDCQQACAPRTKRDVAADCSLPSETGPCRGYFPRYFYNSATGACEQFVYGGCDGNANNFLSLGECQQACSPVDKRDAADCSLASEPGLCRGYFPRYFFNVNKQTCEQFIYGGCGGNSNNYLTVEECETNCLVV